MSVWAKMRGFFLSDEEMGKKDDDHKPFKNGAGLRQPNWHPARVPPRRSLKRIAIVLVVAAVIYLFIKNIPILGPNIQMRRPSYTYLDLDSTHDAAAPRGPSYDRPKPPPARPHTRPPNTPERKYNGPVKFLGLAQTLQGIGATRGAMVINRNVLFATSSLKSAATLLPIACQMGTQLQNYVHFALMSRSDITLQDLREINGIDESCHIIYHDARPDDAQISTEDRMETAVFRALHHIFQYMHPQAIFVDGSSNEEAFFLRGVHQHVDAKKNTLIELPHGSGKRLQWLTKLDSQALRIWNKIHIDILIRAVPGTSGGLIRLLRSLSAADYTSSPIPHLTIELPHDIDFATKHFLENFAWPPAHIPNPTNARYLSLRHRLPRQRMSEEESSARFLESFWPAQPEFSHVLVLSPQAELSPDFFHYLKYTLLEYRYSSISAHQHWDRRLFGISLEQPLQLLDGKGSFSPPSITKQAEPGEAPQDEISTSFLWQAPSSNAVLFLGDKWVELHDFASRSLEVKQGSDPVPALLSEKVVSTQHPSWLEHALRLARARGYWMLYPGVDIARNLATVHIELRHIPEEYDSQENSKPLLADDASEEEIEKVRQKIRAGPEITLASASLLDSLPDKGNLRPFSTLPIVAWDGQETNFEELYSLATKYSAEFREKVGNCGAESEEKLKEKERFSAQDLFCKTE
ncbi:uncharacterized protein F4812DRAFT_418612 [Daldinia caldariorum]|uniref:uncharacterized protein n=1 Tax=Daldinia caldariorum TaxID=326644 RepID=UPI0020089679|nr:uncharacterized protein F4812DRAFT_418612 [Daldinia caldariorum]KAI1470681.1 hypothetical protein F4812DRAFT_418612 [Daldinia caldariorum]